MMRSLVVLVACSACGPTKKREEPAPPMLTQLPKPVAIDTEKFASVIVCDRCHTAGATQMRDRAGRDVSPVTEMRVSMMMLAARDPYYLAQLAREIAANPGAKSVIEKTCIRCHAPVGFDESSGTLTLADLIASKTDAAHLAREGVGCAGCHALDPDGLGEERSLTNPMLRGDRVSFGALPEPEAEAMLQMSKTRPVPSKHISESRLCASCHSVLVHRLDERGNPVGDEVPEQTTYLEWRNSEFQDEALPHGARATTCQGCHMPLGDDELGQSPPIKTAFSTRPVDAPVRETYRRHALRGGNAYMLEALALNADWLNAGVEFTQLADAAIATKQFLLSSAKIEIAGTRDRLAITIVNQTGHKLPTGYPSRRMWLHLVALDDDGKLVFESGRFDARTGTLLDAVGRRIDGSGAIIPHRTTIDATDHVVVWETVPVDAAGKRTHLLLGTASIVKDSRILPAGWRADHPDAKRTRAIGVDGDSDFLPGSDTVTVTLPGTVRRVYATLLYQPIPPETIESYAPRDGPEAARFRHVTRDPPRPLELASKMFELP